jgi:adenylate cyclase
LRDLRAMPLNPAASGVELHARTTEQILLGEFLDRPDWTTGLEVIWLAVLGAVLVFSLPRAGPIRCAVIGAVGVAVSIGASWYAFDRHGLLIDPVFPAAAATMLYVIGSLESFLRTEAERRRVRGAFSHYLSPTMVARLAADPKALRLGGETREMTIMFTDIRRFTSRSEWMDAAALARFLNRFLTPMTAIIHEHRGTLDKYIGDAIMAFWNAPLDDPDHAQHAARAALAMLAGLEALNATLDAEARAAGAEFTPIAIGIGLNSGAVSVGNMGSDQVFGYTVIGDDVNLASRLEGRSKTYGVGIVIGENTQRLLPPGFAVLELDLVRVKGKKRPVTIYTILGDAKTAAEPWFVALSEQHAAMLTAYRSQEWSGATAAILRGRATAGGRLDGLYDLYRERIAAFREHPPPEDWDGVEIATEK